MNFLPALTLVLVISVSTAEAFGPLQVESETNATESMPDDLIKNGGELSDTDNPICVIKFRPESRFDYFDVDQVQTGVFVVPYEYGEQANSSNTDQDPYLADIFRGKRIPPYARIECISTYLLAFKYVGLETLQFFRIWQTRPAINGRILQQIGIEVLLPPSATGEYVFYSPVDPSRRQSVFIFSGHEKSPYLLGHGKNREVYVNASDNIVVLPCVTTKYGESVKLLWEAGDNHYQPLYNSTDASGGPIRYDPKIGFVMNTTGISGQHLLNRSKRSPTFPYGKFKCETERSIDYLFVTVTRFPPPKEDITNTYLDISVIGRRSPPNALCMGQSGSRVTLNKFDANHHEGPLLIRCLLERGSPCGSSFHNGQDFSSFNNIAGLPLLPPAALLICTSSLGEVNHVYYFMGLNGTYYTTPWQKVPQTNLLKLKMTPLLFSNPGETSSGDIVKVTCESAGDVVLPMMLYAKLKYNDSLYSAGDVPPGQVFRLQSSLDEFICVAQYWDSEVPIAATMKMTILYTPCPSEEYFQCEDDQCYTKEDLCLGREKCSDGSSAKLDCHSVFPNGCPSENFWQCKSGHCIKSIYRCDGDNDCRDKSDETAEVCAEVSADRAPLITKGRSTFNVVQYEEINVPCWANYRLSSDTPKVEWSKVEQAKSKTVSAHDGLSILKDSQYGYRVLQMLTISNVTMSQEFICKASNKFGMDSRMIQIIVQESTSSSVPGRPSHPAHPHPEEPPTEVNQPQPFICMSEGKHPDTQNCGIFHECVDHNGNGKYTNYQFACGAGTVYCANNQVCGYEHDCPCEVKAATFRQSKIRRNRA